EVPAGAPGDRGEHEDKGQDPPAFLAAPRGCRAESGCRILGGYWVRRHVGGCEGLRELGGVADRWRRRHEHRRVVCRRRRRSEPQLLLDLAKPLEQLAGVAWTFIRRPLRSPENE